MNKFKILEWFNSIDGESRRAGSLATFIRVPKCNCSCKWCDSKWSMDDSQCSEMSLDEIIIKAKETAYHNITLTGGEPLITENIEDLIKALADNHFDVSIETNGSISIKDKPYYNIPNVWFSMDYKCPSSGMTSKMISAEEMSYLRECDTLKFVVANKEDLKYALNRINEIEDCYDKRNESSRCTYYFSPCFGEIKLIDIVNFMKDNNLQYRVKLQVQLHKIVWDPNERGV